MKNIGLYIHIPFCISKCAYCAFTSSKCSQKEIETYLRSLDREIELVLSKEYNIDTIYIGGGTPSILRYEEIRRIVDKVMACTNMSAVREFTIECNPDSISEEKVIAYKEMGVTRISMGVQSLNDKVLKAIGRVHTATRAIDMAKMVVRHGIDLSVDMILGLPYSTKDDIEMFVDTFTNIGVCHISAYSLGLEEGTRLYDMVNVGKITLPTEDETLDQYDLAYSMLKNRGYYRYEVSNFAIQHHESKHNLKYWNMEEYIGIGLASHSFIDGKRYYNTKDRDEYVRLLQDGKSPSTIDEVLSIDDLIEETIMLGLRTERGFEMKSVEKYLDKKFLDSYDLSKVKDYIIIEDGRVRIRPKYMNVMNTIIVDIITSKID